MYFSHKAVLDSHNPQRKLNNSTIFAIYNYDTS